MILMCILEKTASPVSEKGLGYDVVMQLAGPFITEPRLSFFL